MTCRSILAVHTGTTCTAAALLVRKGGDNLVSLAAGVYNPEVDERWVTVDTVFDLASISKVFTATALLRLVAASRVSLDTAVTEFLPGFREGGREGVRIRHLLAHSSGLPALLHLYGPVAPPDPRLAILKCPLERPPGVSVLYSDVGFMVLGLLLEEICSVPLRVAIEDLVLKPLRLQLCAYGPGIDAPATEIDPLRGRRLQGEVHDENAYVLGGASGHAGLFGCAAEVARLADAYTVPSHDFLPNELVRDAVRVQASTGEERRGLGWDLRSHDASSVEGAFSLDAFGHYGFTGTAIWTDPRRNVTVVLLTNRVYFGRDSSAIRSLRGSVFTAVAEALPL